MFKWLTRNDGKRRAKAARRLNSPRASVFSEFALVMPLVALVCSALIEIVGFWDAQVMANHAAWTVGRIVMVRGSDGLAFSSAIDKKSKTGIPNTNMPDAIKKLIDEMDRLVQVNDENARRKSILLVDDDNAFLKMVTGWLSGTYRVTPVTSGAQALMYIADNKPDLILLDYEMPVTSGPQVLEMIRSETKVDSIPVIFLTGKGDRESVMKVLALKPDGYLLKSTDKTTLLKSLEEFFEKKKYEQLHEMQK